MSAKRYHFKAVLQPGDSGGAYVLFPYDVRKEFGVAGKVPVQATFNGMSYAGSLIKYGHPQHMLPVLKDIRTRIGASIGDEIDVQLWRDEAPRTLEVPAELAAAIKSAGVSSFFDSLSFTHRKEYCRWIAEAKTEATRTRRVAKAVEMLQGKVKTPDAPRPKSQSKVSAAR